MLLEVLVVIVLFALGVLAIVDLQLVAIQQSSAAKSRADASFLANDVIGRMWLSDRNSAALATDFTTGGPQYALWLPAVVATLPGSAANPPTVSVVAITDPPGATASSRVTVRLFWKAPNEPVAEPAHEMTVVAQIR